MTSQLTLGHISHSVNLTMNSQLKVVVKTKPLLLDNTKIARLKSKPGFTFNVVIALLICIVGTVVAIALYTKYYDSNVTQDQLREFSNNPQRPSNGGSLIVDYVVDFSDEPSWSPSIVPISNILRVAPDIMARVYTSRLTVTLACLRKTSHITFQTSLALNLSTAFVQTVGRDERIEVVELTYSRSCPCVRLHLNTSLQPGLEYIVIVEYGGPLLRNAEVHGLSLRDYLDGEGVTRPLVLARYGDGDTNFMFPQLHLDKTNKSGISSQHSHASPMFQLTVRYHKNYSIISSIPLLNTAFINSTGLETTFASSQSPSRFSFILSEYNSENISSVLKVRMHTPSGKSTNASTTKKILQHFLWFLMNGCSKVSALELDVVMLDITNTIAYPGLMILPTSVYSDGDSTPDNMETCTLLLAKELVKQVLTFLSLWKSSLSEALVLYLGYEMVSFYYPSWDMPTKFYLDVTNAALVEEASQFARPVLIKGELEEPEDLGKILKGTALIDMFSGYIGRSNSRKLIKKLCRVDASFNDNEILLRQLVTGLSKNDQSLIQELEAWFTKVGVPLVHVHHNRSKYSFSQSSLLPFIEKSSRKWLIPLSVWSPCNGTMYPVVLSNQSETTRFPIHCNNLKVNSGGNGFYRLQYDDNDANTWVATLISNHQILPAVDRANLISDAFEIARIQPEYITTALRFTLYLHKEHHYVPYTIALQHLRRIVSLLSTTAKKCAERYIQRKVQPVLRYFTSLHRHTHVHRKLIGYLMKEAGGGIGEITTTLQSMFMRWVRSNGRFHLPLHLREAVFYNGVAGGSIYSWNFLFQYYQNQGRMNPGEKDMLLMGLANTPNDVLLQKLVHYPGYWLSVKSSIVLQEKLLVWTHVCGNQHGGKEMALKAFLSHWDHLLTELSDVFPSLKLFLLNCVGSGKHESHAAEIMKLKVEKLPAYLVRVLDMVVERIYRQIKFVKVKQKTIADWFKSQGC